MNCLPMHGRLARMIRGLVVGSMMCGLVGTAGPAAAAEIQLDAPALFERSTGSDVRLSPDDKSVQLAWGELFEDDGPAAGFSYKPNVEDLSGGAWIKKVLVIPQPQAKRALLLLGPRGDIPSSVTGQYSMSIDALAGPGPEIQVTINGKPQTLKFEGEAEGIWDVFSFPPEVLKPGDNEIVIHGAGKMWIARDDEYAAGAPLGSKPPNRSAKSTDGGKTWDDKHLGPNGDIDGEYYIRMFLEHFRPSGSLTLPVLDAGNLSGAAIAPPVAAWGPIRVAVEAQPGSGKIVARARTGKSLSPTADDWSPWQELSFPNGVIENPTGRFVQVSLELATDDGQKSPAIHSVRIEATPELALDWTSDVRVIEEQNPTIVRTSIPFAYEPFDHPSLKKLREKYHLDEVVSGAKDEFDIITRLATWSSKQFDSHHFDKCYPAWDALEILEIQDDGKPMGGYCQQFNLVFLQACESFGIVARAVSLGPSAHSGRALRQGGHEVTEVWLNQFQKWAYIDGHLGWYAVDAETRVPLSLWELRERQLGMIAGEKTRPIEVVTFADNHRHMTWEGLLAHESTPFAEIRLQPRNNFLEQPTPVPLTEGMIGWFWTGHQVWSDERLPAALLYGNRVTRHGDLEWTLNQAHLALEATPTPGSLAVQIDTVTPGLETLLAKIDDSEAKPVKPGFTWTLHPGENRLEVWPRNQAQRDGAKSYVVLDYRPGE